MLISHHISSDHHEALLTDSISFVLDKMEDQSCRQLAVVDQGVLLGIIEENVLLDYQDTELTLHHLKSLFKPIYLFEHQHVYDALEMMANYDLCFIPIIDINHNYIGSATKQNILVALHEILGEDEAAIIILELGPRDNALSHIAHIIESENTIIYSTAIHKIPNSSLQEMTIKVNKRNISAVTAALWRNQYVVKATFREIPDESNIKSRYQQLMNYLDL